MIPSGRRPHYWELAAAVLLTIGAVFVAERLAALPGPSDHAMAAAAERMRDATLAVAERRATYGPPLDPEDVHGTGLIGSFFGPLTTTVGTVEAKRTTTNPNLAALAVRLLADTGVRAGDAIAIGASGSFPAVLLAVLCAADALELEVGLIVSLGASQWGANLVDFTWLDIQDALFLAGALDASYAADAVSFGGANDVGTELDRDVRDALRSRIGASGTPLIEEPDLAENVAARTRAYREAVGGRPIAAFVNIGGAWANVGPGEASLALPPGLPTVESIPPVEARGVLFQFAAEGVPIVHFLRISELAATYGLPWDPSPLPAPGAGSVRGTSAPPSVWAVGLGYLSLIGGWLIFVRRRRRQRLRG